MRVIAAGDPVTFSRPIDAPGGPAEAAFALTFIPEEATPGGAVMFACQHLTPEHLWLPPLKRHPNTAERLDSITAVVDDAAAVAEPYAALFGPDGVTVAAPDDPASAPVPAMVTVATGGIPLRFLTPGALARRYPGVDLGGVRPPAVVGLGIKVRDPTAARVCLDDAGIVPIEVPGGCCVAPTEACGVLIEFRA